MNDTLKSETMDVLSNVEFILSRESNLTERDYADLAVKLERAQSLLVSLAAKARRNSLVESCELLDEVPF